MKHPNHALGLLLATLLTGLATNAQAITWDMNPDASSLGFTGTQTGNEFRGQFRRFETQITLDPADLSTASITAIINTNSIASGSPDRDTDALNVEWFNTGVFPQATFTSTEVVHVEDNAYVAHGTLEIKGTEREIELPFTLDIEGDQAVANGTLSLDRMAYGVGVGGEIEDDSFVGHEVTITLHIEATRAD